MTDFNILDKLIAQEIWKRIDEEMSFDCSNETSDRFEFTFFLGKGIEVSGRCRYYVSCKYCPGDYYTPPGSEIKNASVEIDNLEVYDLDEDSTLYIMDTSGIERLVENMI